MSAGDLEAAADLFMRALASSRLAGDARQTAKVLHSVGDLRLRQGKLDDAEAAYRVCG